VQAEIGQGHDYSEQSMGGHAWGRLARWKVRGWIDGLWPWSRDGVSVCHWFAVRTELCRFEYKGVLDCV